MSVVDGWQLVYSGKVRDLYVPTGEALATSNELLMVASDRVSAFDTVLDPAIPGKGEVLTALTLWWLDRIDLPNQLLGSHDVGSDIWTRIPEQFRGRALLVRHLEMLPIECVVRGAISGSGFAEYRKTGSICGIELPAGLEDGDRLPEPIFTPAWKAPLGQHDENIPFERVVELVGLDTAEALREQSLAVFSDAARRAEARGLVLADTKFEWGRVHGTNELVLADEVLTSDSSRYWDAEAYADGRIESFDKQIVRNWMKTNWNGEGTPPSLPAEIVATTAARYRELLERLTN